MKPPWLAVSWRVQKRVGIWMIPDPLLRTARAGSDSIPEPAPGAVTEQLHILRPNHQRPRGGALQFDESHIWQLQKGSFDRTSSADPMVLPVFNG